MHRWEPRLLHVAVLAVRELRHSAHKICTHTTGYAAISVHDMLLPMKTVGVALG